MVVTAALEQCLGCNGIGWLRRLIAHPCIPGCYVTATRICQYCQGKGKVPAQTALDGKSLAAGEREPTIANDFPGWAAP